MECARSSSKGGGGGHFKHSQQAKGGLIVVGVLTVCPPSRDRHKYKIDEVSGKGGRCASRGSSGIDSAWQ